MAHHHHKSNKQIEGNPDTGHPRGMPRRPDEEELDQRTETDREQAGLPTDPDNPDADYQNEATELDREVAEGEVQSDPRTHRKDRPDFPPSHYES
ncbi:hypothetical protein [Kitasatospora sp. GP30]|uniref:hypothetical protein n=1 Tax=Kitasatospora sp. GP30 TaxID=3035084 RepID=UPI000C707947|nr:hypothetical protein [Kitasatospora sp. GP30]